MREDVGMFGPEQMSPLSLNDLFEQTENNISPTNVVMLKRPFSFLALAQLDDFSVLNPAHTAQVCTTVFQPVKQLSINNDLNCKQTEVTCGQRIRELEPGSEPDLIHIVLIPLSCINMIHILSELHF